MKGHHDEISMYLFFIFYSIVLLNIVLTCFSEKYKYADEKEMVNVEEVDENMPKKLVSLNFCLKFRLLLTKIN